MSPALFNIQICICSVYAEKLLQKALEKVRGVVVGRKPIKTIKYADDVAVLTEPEKDLQVTLAILLILRQILRK